MVTKKAKRLLAVEFLDNDPQELILANYLKSKKDVKGQVLAATKAHFYALALSEDPNSSDEDIELAILESLQSLWGQMNYIVDYHRIKRKINLTPQSLMRFGLGSTTPASIVSPSQQLARAMVRPERESLVIVEADEREESSSNASNASNARDDDNYIPVDLSDDPDSFSVKF